MKTSIKVSLLAAVATIGIGSIAMAAKNGGYGLGTVGTSIIFLSIITSLIIYLSLKQQKNQHPPLA